MNVEQLVDALHPLERQVVPHLKKEGALTELAAKSGLSEVEAMRALQWLEGKGCLSIKSETHRRVVVNSEAAERALKEGLPEEHALRALKRRGTLPVKELASLMPSYDKGATNAVLGILKRAGIPLVTTEQGERAFTWVDLEPALPLKAALEEAKRSGWKLEEGTATKELLARKGYAERKEVTTKRYTLTPLGERLAKAKLGKAGEERLTPEMLRSGSWKEKRFRPYNVAINVPRKSRGRRHFVHEAIESIKRIWLDLGFTEMTGKDIQTAFWDLDALFVPQDHPAREMQDTFYLKKPATGALPKLYDRVKRVHEDGGDTGSLGWRYPFSTEESEKLLLRTHTTVLSAQTLERIGKGELPMPGKYFSVAKVYRNEALDWKHLFEFYQVEGIVVDEQANLQHLKGYLREFFGKMGYPDVRIRPGHFPYTEPSCEVDVYDPAKQQWVELGGAGIFRPEVTKPLLGREVPVLAWGLGMERIIKEYYDITDIRDLYRNDKEQLEGMKAWLPVRA